MEITGTAITVQLLCLYTLDRMMYQCDTLEDMRNECRHFQCGDLSLPILKGDIIRTWKTPTQKKTDTLKMFTGQV